MTRFLSALIAVGLACTCQAAPVSVENIRIWAAPDSTRIVFDVSAPVEHELNFMTDPFRVVVDIKSIDTYKIFSLRNPFRVVNACGVTQFDANSQQEPIQRAAAAHAYNVT